MRNRVAGHHHTALLSSRLLNRGGGQNEPRNDQSNEEHEGDEQFHCCILTYGYRGSGLVWLDGVQYTYIAHATLRLAYPSFVATCLDLLHKTGNCFYLGYTVIIEM